MKYTRETLLKLKDALNEFGNVPYTDEVSAAATQSINQLADHSASEDQRSAADEVRKQLYRISEFKTHATAYAVTIQNILDGKEAYPEGAEREIDAFLERLKNRTKSLKEDLDSTIIQSNYNYAPDRNSGLWGLNRTVTSLYQISDRIDSIQNSNSISVYKEAQKSFDDQMTYLAAVTGGDNTKISDIPDELTRAKKELKEANDKLDNLVKSEGTWKRNYLDAKEKVEKLPAEQEKLENDLRDLREIVDNDDETMKDIATAREKYIQQEADRAKTSKELEDVSFQLTEQQRQVEFQRSNEKQYPMQIGAAVNGKVSSTTEQRQQLHSYAEAKEKELRYGKALALTEELEKTIGMQDDSLVRTVLFGKTAIKARNGFLGFGKREGQVGFPKNYLNQLEATFGEAQKERLAKARDLVSQIQEVLPKDEKTKSMLEKPFGKDGLEFVQNLKGELKQTYDDAKQSLENNEAYKYTKSLTDQADQLRENILALNKQDLSQYPEEIRQGYERQSSMLREANYELQHKLATNPMDTKEIDEAITRHVESSQKLGELESQVEQLQERKETLEWRVKVQGDTLDKLKTDIIKNSDVNYQELVRTEQDVVAEEQAKLDAQKKKKDKPKEVEKPSDTYLKQMLAHPDNAGTKFFDNMQKQLSEKARVNQASIDATQNKLTQVWLDIPKARNAMEKYSFANYKAALHEAAIKVGDKQVQVDRFTKANAQLVKAQESYNRQNQSIVAANTAFDKTKEDILKQIEAFKNSLDKNKKPGHNNSPKYDAIKTSLESFTKEKMANMSPDQLKSALEGLSRTVRTYQDAKADQWRLFPSPQRKFRNNLADSIQSFIAGQNDTLGKLGIDDKAWQAMQDAKQNPPQQINDLKTFAEKAETMRAGYDQKTRDYQHIIREIARSYKAKLTETDWEMTDADRREVIINALVSEEMEKKVYAFDPTKKTVDAYKLELETMKNQLKEDIEKNYGGLIDQAMEDEKKDKKLTGGHMAYRKASQDVAPRFRNIQNYEQPQNVNQNVNQNANQRRINNPQLV